MKKFFMYFAAAVLLLSFNSCSDESSLKSVLPIPTPSMNWGASERTIEKEMKDLGYRLEDEERDSYSSEFIFSYDHGKYYVYCVFLYSEYTYFVIDDMRKADAEDVIEWLDKHYIEEGYERYDVGFSSLYKSKDEKSWSYVNVGSSNSVIYWGSMKYGAEIYEGILDDLR